MKPVVCLITKFPEAGKVKTRLAKDIGNRQAADLLANFLKILCNEHTNQSYAFITSLKPFEKKDEFTKLFNVQHIIEQKGNNLTEILHNALDILKNYSPIIFIGSDTPNLTKEDIQQTRELLKTHEVVIGPANDGGYYLIGINQKQPLFENITWSTQQVLEQTIELCKKHNLSYTLLEEKTDIDTLQDLEEYQNNN